MTGAQTLDIARAREALHAIPPDLDRESWVRTGMAAHAAGLTFDDFNDWSADAGNYQPDAARSAWRSFKPGKGIGPATLFHIAQEHGWTAPKQDTGRKPSKSMPKPRAAVSVAEVLARANQAASHAYIDHKGAQGVPLDGLYVLPDDDPLRIGGESMAGALLIPALGTDGQLQSAQLIPPRGKKMNLPGHPMAGASFTVGHAAPGEPVYLCEGIGQAWACWKATGHAAVVCFGWGNVRKVADQLKDKGHQLVLVPDAGKEDDARKIAHETGAAVAFMPEGSPANFDASDLTLRDGADMLLHVLEQATAPEPPPLPLSVAFADQLPAEFSPPDELIEGLFTAGDSSIVYGDSNSGKTFLMVDLAAAVARGVDWMGRRTEQGLVIFLAAESPASVRSRLQAYREYHGVPVPNFAIVQSPVDLFAGDVDTDAVIEVVRRLEKERGVKARLIVGDTLARLSAGANENAAQDMGLVVRRIDRIRAECHAHFTLIHHTGKNAANGARGWSGIRAAVDTEIEVQDLPEGRCLEVTKQRDLPSKGERIGFRLEPVTLGLTKWGTPASSCVVLAHDAPAKPKGKRMGEVEGAVVEYLAQRKTGVKKREIADHFEERYAKGSVYRAIKSVVTAGAAHEAAGIVCIAGVVG